MCIREGVWLVNGDGWGGGWGGRDGGSDDSLIASAISPSLRPVDMSNQKQVTNRAPLTYLSSSRRLSFGPKGY